MDTTLNLPLTASTVSAPASVLDRSIIKKVTPIDAGDKAITRPAEKPFVAQVVKARLSGTVFPENPTEIMPADRTLRPYGMPMLPHNPDSQTDAKVAETPAPAVKSLP